MKNSSIITLIIGIGLLAFGIYHLLIAFYVWGIMKAVLGAALIYLSFSKSRTGMIIFGHVAIFCGCMLVTAGLYYAPMISDSIKSSGTGLSLVHIFGYPLFWGIFSIFGGICAIYHGFCKCVRRDWK